ncbi:MAG: tetratricopeptide repeat protein [Myxococcota bacterium]|nr:tetratricopeptide repeat protein [Myxococcota bacterium]
MRWLAHTETVHLSGAPPETGSVVLELSGGASQPARRLRRWHERPGLQARLFAHKKRAEWRGPSLRTTIALLALLCAVLSIGTVAGRLVRSWRHRRLMDRAAAAAAEAHRRGRPEALMAAAARYGDVLALHPTDASALRRRAMLLAEALFEFGGPPPPDDAGLRQEAESAVRLVQGDDAQEAHAAQAFLLLLAGDADGAAPRVRALRGTPLGDYLEGQILLLRGEDAQAQRALWRATQQEPHRPQWHLRLAAVLEQMGRPREAEAALAAALQASPLHPGARIAKGCRGGPEGEHTLRALLEPAGAAAPLLGRLEAALGWLCLGERALREAPPELARARRLLRRAQELTPPGAVLLRERLASTLLAAGDRASAEREARAVLQVAPRRARAVLLLARALLGRAQAEETLEVLAPLLGAGHTEAQLLRARALLLLDETLEAQAAAQAVATTESGELLAEAYLVLTRAALALGETQQARALLARLSAMEPLEAPQRHEAELLEAQLLAQSRAAARARATLERLLRQAPQLLEARLLLAQLLRTEGQLRAAREQLESVLELEEHAGARRALAELALDAGDAPQARRHYEQLLQGAPDGELLVGAARAYRLSGDAEGALRLLEQLADRRDGGGEEGLIEQARALLQLGRADQAVVLLRDRGGAARRATVPALLMRALLHLSMGHVAARRVLAALPAAQRRDPEVQLAEAELLLQEGKATAARRLLVALLQRPAPARISPEEADLRADARALLDRTRK